MRSADKVKPLLNLVFIYKSCILALALCGEEYIEVKLVELSLHSYTPNFLGYLVGHENHSRQCKIRIPRTFPFGFGALFIGICPVEYLFLDELTAVYRAERRTRKIEIVPRRNRQECFVAGISRFLELIFLNIEIRLGFFIGIVEQLSRVLAPCAKMVLVKDYDIPVVRMDKLVLCLYTAVFVCAKQILKRTENNNRL